jgi:hypothetical protein
VSSSEDDRATQELTVESLGKEIDRLPPEEQQRLAGKLLAHLYDGKPRTIDTPMGPVNLRPPSDDSKDD